jgi:hypothetical protein
MKSNEILTEIRQPRDDLARETGYDLQRLFDYIRQREREAAARGVKFVASTDDSHAESVPVLGEQPPKPLN